MDEAMSNMHLEGIPQNTGSSNWPLQDGELYVKPPRVIFDLTKNVFHNDSDDSGTDNDVTTFCCGPVFLSNGTGTGPGTITASTAITAENASYVIAEKSEPNKSLSDLSCTNGYWNWEDNSEPDTAQLVYHLDHNLIYSDSEDSYTSIDAVGDTEHSKLYTEQNTGEAKLENKKEGEYMEDICIKNEKLYGRLFPKQVNSDNHGKKNTILTENYAKQKGIENDKHIKSEQSDIYIKDKIQHIEGTATNLQNVAFNTKLESIWKLQENVVKKQHRNPHTKKTKEGRRLDKLLNVTEYGGVGDILMGNEDTETDKNGVFSNVVRVIQDAQKSLDMKEQSGLVVLDGNQYSPGRTYKVEMEWIKVQQLGMVTFQEDQ